MKQGRKKNTRKVGWVACVNGWWVDRLYRLRRRRMYGKKRDVCHDDDRLMNESKRSNCKHHLSYSKFTKLEEKREEEKDVMCVYEDMT